VTPSGGQGGLRRALDLLYRASGALAAVFLVLIAVAVLLQVGANLIDAVLALVTGSAIGLVVPSYAEFTGFFLAASSFLALAYALKAGAHIRVGLAIGRLPGRARQVVEAWCCLSGAAISGYFAAYTLFLVLESWEFNDRAIGMVPVPLWIPQASVALGLIVLTIALLDELVTVLRGGQPAYETVEVEVNVER
jgi:TRAP-type C4-dicarboxylate transport system permease small subunit